MTRMEDWDKSYDDFYINDKNPRPEEEIADDILREVVGDHLNDKKKKKLLEELWPKLMNVT